MRNGDPEQDGNDGAFVWPPALDQLRKDGIQRGPAGSRAAIKKVLKLEPTLTRPEVWERIRRLKHLTSRPRYQRSAFTAEGDGILRSGYACGWRGKREAVKEIQSRHPDWPPHVVWSRAATLGLRQEAESTRPNNHGQQWDEESRHNLLDLAGHESARKIGVLMRRTERAVRCQLTVLEESSRVSDAYTKRALATMLHTSRRTLRRLIEKGELRMRDPRISTASLHDFCERFASPLGLDASSLQRELSKSPDGLTTSRVSKLLGVDEGVVQRWIARRMLNIQDGCISDRAFEEFCRKCPERINYALMDKDLQKWIREYTNVSEDPPERYRCPASQKHALILRTCAGCRREIRGNAYFLHIRVCSKLHDQGANTGALRKAS